MKVLLSPLCVCPFSTLHLFLLVSRVNADFTTKNWKPVRGRKFTIAWSGTSDAGLKNLTLNDADSSGNEFAVVQNIATGIDGGSFTWLPSTSIPDGTYVVNLYETPNKVDKNGLTFIGKPFVFGNASANQPAVVNSPTTTAGAAQVVQTTTPVTTTQQQETTVLDPTTIVIISTSPIYATTQADENLDNTSTSSVVIPTSAESSLENSSTSILSNIPSTFTTIPTSLSVSISPSPSPTTPPISTSTSTPPPTPPAPTSSSHSSQNPSPPSSTPPKTAIILSTTSSCLLLLSLISIYLLHRYHKIKLKELGLVNNGHRWWYRWENGRIGNGGIVSEGIGSEKVYYDAQKRNWVLRVNSRPVELEGRGWLGEEKGGFVEGEG
ncbi:hypothetical protein EAF04_010187 [Stromatinia cepivora]|nr:hypothetical protein EAF04_010187 [Stromatinia cepivora]